LPDQAIPIFKKFNLKHVDLGASEVISSAKDCPKLEFFIDRITADASPDPYACLSEGSVVYATDCVGKVLFLAKVKTTKYRILRRLRELSKNAASAKSKDNMRTRFRQDLKKWGFIDPKDVTAYMELLEACEHVRITQKWSMDNISKWYINFLHEAIKELEAGNVNPSAPVVDICDGEVVGEAVIEKPAVAKKSKPHGKSKWQKKDDPKHEVESSDDEDRAFSNLKGHVKV
jgi:hypothetical protein